MITYIKGDATNPLAITPDKNCIIVHCCNDVGAWGKGFVLAISKKWKTPELRYKEHYKSMNLGDIEMVLVEPNIVVCNLIGQHNIISNSKKWVYKNGEVVRERKTINAYPNDVPIRYEAIRTGLKKLKMRIKDRKDVAIHLPKIGSGLAGGDWNVIERIINEELRDCEVYVYEL